MDFYDIYVTSEDIKEKIEMAEMLGFSGIGFAKNYGNGNDMDSFIEEIENKRDETDVDLITCCDVDVESTDMLKKIIGKVRQKVEVVLVRGGDFEINKAAVRDSRVDVLLHPEYKRKDRGLDHKLTNSASKNDVSIGIVLHPLLQTYGKLRSHIFKHIRDNLKLCDKYNVPVTVASGARKRTEMRDPRELASVPECLGSEPKKSVNMVSKTPSKMIQRNRKKLDNKIRKKGVEEES